MAAQAQAATTEGWKPSISDEKVKAATGRGWMGWFVILNKANATALPHKEIAQYLHEKGCPGWWAQMISVEYERARGGRQKHKQASGFSVSITKVMPVNLPVVGFYAKGAGKSQIALQVSELPDAGAVEKERAAWKKAFEKLAQIVTA